jgi:hypothetical protein
VDAGERLGGAFSGLVAPWERRGSQCEILRVFYVPSRPVRYIVSSWQKARQGVEFSRTAKAETMLQKLKRWGCRGEMFLTSLK